MILIGLAGRAGSGKDTVADYLTDQYLFERYAFADPVRNGLKAMLGYTSRVFAPDLKEKPDPLICKSPRELMQTLGTEWGRKLVHDELWLMIAGLNLAKMRQAGMELIVVTDVRFENEAAWIRQQGGQVWHIRRDSAARVNDHISEQGIAFQPALGDLAINNNGTIADLYEMLEVLGEKLAEAA